MRSQAVPTRRHYDGCWRPPTEPTRILMRYAFGAQLLAR
jgi:hypothetical protein